MRLGTGLIVSTLGSLGMVLAVAVAARASDGDAAYAANCATCHGADGRSDTPVGKAMKASSLVDSRWAATDSADAMIAAFHAKPKHKTVAGKLTDAQLAAIASHVQALASAEN